MGSSIDGVTHTLHYRLKMLENVQRIDGERGVVGGSAAQDGGRRSRSPTSRQRSNTCVAMPQVKLSAFSVSPCAR